LVKVILLLVVFAAMTSLFVPSKSSADEYKLGPQDKLRIQVFEWRDSVYEVFDWPALTGDFTVGSGGMISFPLIGRVSAAGLTTGEFGEAIANQMKARIGMTAAPAIGVEIVQYRPFYIIGDVNAPGEYPYRPGLTVLQSFAIAGGLLRLQESGLPSLGREAIATEGEIQTLAGEINAARARKARLEAELQNAERVRFPPVLEQQKDNPAIKLLMEQELLIFEGRQKSTQAEIEALENLKEFFANEIVSLGEQLEVQIEQINLMREELGSVASLVKRGLAASNRARAQQRLIAELEGERLRLETNLLRARQETSRTEISVLQTRNKITNEVTASLRETEAKLQNAISRHETAKDLLSETYRIASHVLVNRRRSADLRPVFSIVRHSNGNSQEIAASETSAVRPGDTVRVVLPISRNDDLDLVLQSDLSSLGKADVKSEVAPPYDIDMR
jgi:polysaccharide export outer membrane protein/exopolysaccharide production protein ExoF